MNQMVDFGNHATEWMKLDSNRVIAIHCKGGKGRTGTMMCVWLLRSKAFTNAYDALIHFRHRRTGIDGADEV